MSYHEQAVLFDCGGDELIGVAATPADPRGADTGLLVVVGGPQYRVGSHRLFVRLCRHLAAHGIPTMRFDHRGIGDAGGEERPFTAISRDIRAAIDAFCRQVPGLRRVVLWGLCDAASAACIYAPQDPRLAGLVLLNPWVRTETGEAMTRLRHYYPERLRNPRFWAKVAAGRLSLANSGRTLLRLLSQLRPSGGDSDGETRLARRMARALDTAGKPFGLILSGGDLVAREFEDHALLHADWAGVARQLLLARVDLPEADHTFSSPEWCHRVVDLTQQWVVQMSQGRSRPKP